MFEYPGGGGLDVFTVSGIGKKLHSENTYFDGFISMGIFFLPVLFLFLLPNTSPDEECVAMEKEQSELSLKRAQSSAAKLERARSLSKVTLKENLTSKDHARSKEVEKMLKKGEGSIIEDLEHGKRSSSNLSSDPSEQALTF